MPRESGTLVDYLCYASHSTPLRAQTLVNYTSMEARHSSTTVPLPHPDDAAHMLLSAASAFPQEIHNSGTA